VRKLFVRRDVSYCCCLIAVCIGLYIISLPAKCNVCTACDIENDYSK